MMAKGTAIVTQPYKFLDYYGFEDCHIFFGRERETEILLSDIIATRLVVLFAKTGTGKTSLINAGVRPRLEELDYETFYIRVEQDPMESVRKALRDNDLLPSRLEGKSLATQLEHVVRKLDKPVVVFFDQFEEFFIYILNEDPEKAQQFMADIAKVYRNRESGIHIVFSMREEFFVEMDAFRDEIPSIFHNDSNLRLRWFNANQAWDAIVLPAQKFGVEIEDKLVEQLISDLAQDQRIEPARLQIVCDTLWRQRTDGLIRLGDYEERGGAEQILDRRLGDDVDQNLDDGQLRLFEKLLPELSTERGTKYVRGFDELVKTLETNAASLRKLIDQLKELRLLRESTQYGVLYIEWTSDYLAERTDYLQKRVGTISIRRLLKAAMDRAEAKKAELAEQESLTDTPGIRATTEDDLEALYMTQSDFEAISERSDFLEDLNQAEAEFLFVATLEHGTYMSLWFEKASLSKVEAWQILRDKIINEKARIGQAENAVRLLGELGTDQALELLETALQQDALSVLTIAVLADMKTPKATRLLKIPLQQEDLAESTIAMLSRMRTKEAVELLESVLQQEDLALQAERALERISKSTTSQAAIPAKSILDRWRERGRQPIAERQRRPIVERRKRSIVDGGLEERDWDALIQRIKYGKCTPILGAGASAGVLPLGSEIARQWAQNYDYPLEDYSDLARVAQFLAVQYDSMFPKEEILERFFTNISPPDFRESDEPHGVLADLPLPVYMTTNYDDFMVTALKSRNKAPRRELCRWNELVKGQPCIFESEPGFRPTPANPVVFHLHGHKEVPESLVLTEDDYLDFLVNISRDQDLLPPRIQEALTATSLLFIGYHLADWSFRVLFRGLIAPTESSLRRISVIVLLPSVPTDAPASIQQRAQRYSDQYFLVGAGMRVYWGTVRDFMMELRQRWRDFPNGT